MEELSKSILMGNKSAFEITMETSLKFIPLLFEHYGYLFRNDTKVKDIVFSNERHYDAVVTRSVIGMQYGHNTCIIRSHSLIIVRSIWKIIALYFCKAQLEAA